MTNKNILLLEDEPTIQKLIHTVLVELFPQHSLFLAGSIKSCRNLIMSHDFALAILDIHLPDGSGLDILASIKKYKPDTICIMSTIFDDKTSIFSALQRGADGYIIKDNSNTRFRSHLESIIHGEPPLSPKVARLMLSFFKNSPPIGSNANLSVREIQILSMIAKGMRNKEIASELSLSIYTIMDHIKHIYKKLHISSRAEAAIKAQKMGLMI